MDVLVLLYFFKQKTAYEVRISDWSSDVCSSDLRQAIGRRDECHRRWVFRNPRASSTSSSCPNPRGRGGSGIRPARSRDRAPRRPRRFLRHNVSLRREIRQAAIGCSPSTCDGPIHGAEPEIGRAHVWTPVTNAHLVCRLLLEKKKN